MTKSSKKFEVFYSYAHEEKDEALVLDLRKQLSILKRSHLITDWYDREIPPGAESDKEINAHMETAEIILLLISPDFIASDYCYSDQMKRAMERYREEKALVIPIILRPVAWESAPFGNLDPLPTDRRPVTSWSNPDEAFLDVTKGIEKAVKQLLVKFLLNEGNDLIEAASYAEAIVSFDQVIKNDADNFLAYCGMGKAFAALRDNAKALEAFERSIALKATAEAYAGKGKVLKESGRNREALDAFEEAISRDPDNAEYFYHKGYLLNALNKPAEALKAYNRSLSLDAGYIDALEGKGSILRTLKRYEEARAAFEQIIRLNPDNARAYESKGQVLLELLKYEEAIIAFERVICLEPENVAAFTGKGHALYVLQRYAEALEVYDRAIVLNATIASFHSDKVSFPRFCGIVKAESILFQRENQEHAKSPKDLHPGV